MPSTADKNLAKDRLCGDELFGLVIDDIDERRVCEFRGLEALFKLLCLRCRVAGNELERIPAAGIHEDE
jgi:hypothetical protein